MEHTPPACRCQVDVRARRHGPFSNSITLIPCGTVSGGWPMLGRGLYLMHWPSCTPSPALPYIRSACEQSLKDLGLSHLDLYLMHWPEAWVPGTEGLPEAPQSDTSTTIEQTWWVLLCRDGDGAGMVLEVKQHGEEPSWQIDSKLPYGQYTTFGPSRPLPAGLRWRRWLTPGWCGPSASATSACLRWRPCWPVAGSSPMSFRCGTDLKLRLGVMSRSRQPRFPSGGSGDRTCRSAPQISPAPAAVPSPGHLLHPKNLPCCCHS